MSHQIGFWKHGIHKDKVAEGNSVIFWRNQAANNKRIKRKWLLIYVAAAIIGASFGRALVWAFS